MKSNIQLKYSNYVAFSHFHGYAVNNPGLDIIWNQKLKTAEISVVNDAGFKAIIIGSTQNLTTSRGYMYLFYTNDSKVLFPSVKEIIRRLKIVASGERLTDQDAEYFDWEEYGSLEMQRIYFSEIIKREAKTT